MGRTIIVSGYFGAGNRGDDVIVSTLLEALRAIPDTEVVIASPHPDRAERDYGVPAFNRLDQVESASWAAVASAVLLGPGGLWDDYSIHTVGGMAGVTSGAVRSPAHLVQLPLQVVGYGGRFRGVGLGAGPLRDKDSRAAVRLSLVLADDISVRDRESLELLLEISPASRDKVRVAPDLAYASPVASFEDLGSKPDWVPAGRYIGISLRPWESGEAQQRIWDEANLVAEEQGLEILCLPMQSQDAPLLAGFPVARGIQVHHMPVGAGHEEFMAALSGAEAVVAMRLHAGLLAHLAGTPAVGVSYHPKVASHYADIGRQESCIELDAPEGALASTLRRVLRAGMSEGARAEVLHRAADAKQMLRELCADLGSLPPVGPEL